MFTPTQAPSPNNQSGKKMLIKITLWIIVLSLISFSVWFFVFKKPNKEDILRRLSEQPSVPLEAKQKASILEKIANSNPPPLTAQQKSAILEKLAK